MIAKTVEIRDLMTYVGALAVKLEPTNDADRYILARAGYGLTPKAQSSYVLLMRLDGDYHAGYDPYSWPTSARTMPQAHQWIIDHFDELESGAVVDVEYILGERPEPKVSELTLNPGPHTCD